MQTGRRQALDNFLRRSIKYLFYNSFIRQCVAKNPALLDLDKNRAMAKSTLQNAQPANFSGIAENHDGPAKTAQFFVLIMHISSNRKEKNKY